MNTSGKRAGEERREMERMEKEMIFHILGIPETGDEGEIRQ